MSLRLIEKRDYTKIKIPGSCQDIIPLYGITPSGIGIHSNRMFSKTYEFSDIDFSGLDDEDKESIFFSYSDILNSWSGTNAQYKISIFNRNKVKQQTMHRYLGMIGDGFDPLREEYNRLRDEDFVAARKELCKYLTVTTYKKDVPKAESFFQRMDADLPKRFRKINSEINPLSADEKLHMLYDFLNCGQESMYVPLNEVITSGTDFKSYICPAGMKFHNTYFEMGDKIGRVLTLRTWSKNIKDTFINDLTSIDSNFMLTMDVIALSSAEIDKLLEDKDSDVESSITIWSNSKNARTNRAAVLPRNFKKSRKALDEYTADIEERNQKVFLAQMYMIILADTRDELDSYTESISEIAAEHTCNICTAMFMQLEGFTTAMPFGIRTIQNLRDCNTETLAMMLPFRAQKLNHNTGIPYGKHKATGEQIFIDRRLLANGNEIVLGCSGSGKSQNVKLKNIYTALTTNGMIIIIDPDGEYAPEVSLLGGKIIRIGIDRINALEMEDGYGFGNDPLKEKSNFVLTLFENIINDPGFFNESKKSIVDRCLNNVYNAKLYYGESLSLAKLYDEILAQPEPEANQLALALERHIKGSYNIFAYESNVDTNYRILCYDISHLDKQLKDAGMLVCLDAVNNHLARNRYYNVPTYITIDELNVFLKHPNSCAQVESFFQRARKYGGFVTGIIQDVDKVIDLPFARSMLNNSKNVIMMGQSELEAYVLAGMYNLSEQDRNFLISCEPGEGINKIDKTIFQFDGRIPRSNLLYQYVNTDGHSKF